MKIGIFTFGSRGDVQPYIALAVGLRQAGHEVFLCAPSDFAELVEAHGITFRPLSLSFTELQKGPTHKQLLASTVLGVLRARRRFKRLGDTLNRDAWRLLKDAEAIIYMPLALTAVSVAQKLDVPSLQVFYVPLQPSAELAPVIAGMSRSRGRIINRLASEIGFRAVWRVYGCTANGLRRELAVKPVPFWGPLRDFARLGHPILYVCSPAVVPKPSDWRKDIHIVGFCYLDSPGDWQPPADLLRFLDAGPPPVFIGFGSMTSANPTATTAALVEAVQRSGQRAILQRGLAQLGSGVELPEQIFLAGDIPHRWLFDRVSAIMHHGGAGTTAAAYRAGVPQIIVPHMLDQPFWAHRAYELGVSPKPFGIGQLTVDHAVQALQAVSTDQTMRQRAAEVGSQVRAEDGVGRSVELFEEYVARFRSNRAN